MPINSQRENSGSQQYRLLRHEARLDRMLQRPHRKPILHWSAFAVAAISFVLLLSWMAQKRGPVPGPWVQIDLALGVASAIEFFTRSGFRWKPVSYIITHFFDFAAIVPALALVNQGYPFETPWVWVVLVARGARMVDRLFGDGFVQRNALALLEGFEEEITDRVLIHIITRIQADVARGRFGKAVGEALERNKASVLQRVKDAHPKEGAAVHIARATGLEAALEHAEERIYDAIIAVINSPEMDKALRDALDAAFISVREQIGAHSWQQHLGFRRGPIEPGEEDDSL